MKATLSREQVRQVMPHGYLTQIAQEAGVSFATVSNWFRGQSDNIIVERLALSKYNEIVKMRKELGYAPKVKK